MKLLYIANARLPTEKAHGVQIIKMCEVFQRLGVQVELLVPFRVQSERMKQVQNLWTHYAVETPFAIRRLPAPDTIRLPGRIPGKIRALLYQLQSLLFSLLALLVTLFQRDSVYYTRHVQPLLVLCLTRWLHRKPIYFEAHELHGKPDGSGLRPVVYRAVMGWMLRQVDGMIVITHGLKRLYAGMGLDERKILVAPDGIESKRLHGVPDKFAARQHLQLPLEKKILCYTGHLFPWKGVYTLAASAQYLPDDVMIYLVGGMEDEVRAMRQFIDWQQLSQVIATGYVPYADVPRYLGAADVLVLPNTAKASISREYTSPLKLFEYMAAQRPIVASDLPSLREILTHQATAYLVPPDNPEALAKGIIAVLEDETLRAQMVRTAYAAVQEYTWERRGRNILEFLHLLPQQSVSREERTSDEGNESAGFR